MRLFLRLFSCFFFCQKTRLSVDFLLFRILSGLVLHETLDLYKVIPCLLVTRTQFLCFSKFLLRKNIEVLVKETNRFLIGGFYGISLGFQCFKTKILFFSTTILYGVLLFDFQSACNALDIRTGCFIVRNNCLQFLEFLPGLKVMPALKTL